MRSILLGGLLGLWICAAACGQADEPMALDSAPAATAPAPVPDVAPLLVEPPLQEPVNAVPATASALAVQTAPASEPATQPAPLRIAGLPARQWLNVPAPIRAHNLEGRLWVLGVVEPWSERSRQAAAELAKVAGSAPQGVEVLLVTVAPAEEVRKVPALASLPLPIGTGSRLPLLLPLEVLPQVHLVGPDYSVAWSGSVEQLAEAVGRYYEELTPGGLSKSRENELANRLNRAKAAIDPAPAAAGKYFIAVGLASTVVDATPPPHSLHRQAADLLGQADKRGEDLLAAARDLVKQGKGAEAYERLQGIAEGFFGRPAGTQAMKVLQDFENHPDLQADVLAARDEASADGALRMARQAMTDRRYGDAERYYRMISEVYPRTRAAGQAGQALVSLHKDKVAATQLAAQKAEPQAPVLLSLAGRYAQMGRTEEARQHYQQVLQMAPGTPYAKQAQEELALLPSSAASQPVNPARKGK